MPQISARRLHTRDFMSRVLARAGQFAHIDTALIDVTLSNLYRPSKRWEPGDDFDNARSAVSDELVKLHHGRMIPMVFDADGTIDFFERHFGILCPLCRTISSGWGTGGGHRLSLLVSPTYLFTQPEHRSYRGALCSGCWKGIFNTFGVGTWWEEDRNMMLSAIAMLITKESFRKRVAANRTLKIRFDPRRIIH